MVEERAEVCLVTGLHARAAALLVSIANRYRCESFIILDTKKINAKSIMGVLSLGIPRGAWVTIQCEGEDEQDALHELITFVQQEKTNQ